MDFEWRGLGPQELEHHYNPRASIGQKRVESYLARFQSQSAEARRQIQGDYDLRYGPAPLQTFDLHKPAGKPPFPTLIFIHGGFWRSLDKSDHSFVAPPLVAAGVAVVNLNYDLCPKVTLDDIVREAREALLYLWRNGEASGLDRTRLHISGHSAGAHLCGMLLNHDWRAAGLPEKPVASAICSSGIYEPEPVIGTTVNNDLRLTLDMARRNDCVARPPRYDLPLTIIVGGAEPAGWIAQSERYHEACRSAGVGLASLHVVAGANHLNLLHAAAADRALAAHVLAQLRAG